MDIAALIVQIVGGAVGGTAGGKLLSASDMGRIGNLIAGAIGGVGGGTLLESLISGGLSLDGGSEIAALISQLVGSGVGGIILQVVIGLLKNKLFAK